MRSKMISLIAFLMAGTAGAMTHPTLDQHTSANPLPIGGSMTITGRVMFSNTQPGETPTRPAYTAQTGQLSGTVGVTSMPAITFTNTQPGETPTRPAYTAQTGQLSGTVGVTSMPVVSVTGSLMTDTNMDGIVDAVETGTPFVSGFAKHVLAVGVRPSASSYRVTMTAATITNLTPVTLTAASHITIFNDDNAAMFVGGADVASSGDHLGITIPAGGSYTLDQINGSFTIFGINTGAGSAEILRW